MQRALGLVLRRRGVEARSVRCATQPTASTPRRADARQRQVIDSGGRRATELHFIGHSTGGLDVRMLLTPGLKTARGESAERIALPTRTATTVTMPHHVTPLADHVIAIQNQTLPHVLGALATSGEGRAAILAAAKAITLAARVDNWIGQAGGPLARIAKGMLRRMRYDRRDPVWQFRGGDSTGSRRVVAAHAGRNRID
jgi:triacylglycerol lipase